MVTFAAVESEAVPATGYKVLIVEDAADLRSAMDVTLHGAGYETCTAGRGDEALRIFYEFQPDLVLLDLGLPGMKGIDVCEAIRRLSSVPIIIFTALGATKEKLQAFERGADDYIVKGTEMDEILARVRVSLRRSAHGHEVGEAPYTDAVLQIDFSRRIVMVRGEMAELTRTEYELLTTLVSAGQPMSAGQLLRTVWGPEYTSDELVKWHIGRLRKKIEGDPEDPHLVVTRRGFMYMYIRPS